MSQLLRDPGPTLRKDGQQFFQNSHSKRRLRLSEVRRRVAKKAPKPLDLLPSLPLARIRTDRVHGQALYFHAHVRGAVHQGAGDAASNALVDLELQVDALDRRP